jgi:FAD/FMN-containing dehydrogenase
MSSARIQPLNIKVFQTIHKNFTYAIDNLFDVMNGDNPDVLAGYNETTLLIQQFLKTALDQKKSVRALGGNWSWTTAGFTKGWMLSTLKLNRIKRMLPTDVHPATGAFEQDRFLFTQCGCTVIELNQVCRFLKRSLKTSGASNGQSIAGLISNCTHGSAIDFGSSPDFVVGLHLIVSPDKHIYLERASQPVVTQSYIQRLRAEHILDDALFNAALVSFGSFGFIHGVMIETDPIFLYNVFRKQLPTEQIHPLLQTLDFSHADFLPRPNIRPYHFQVTINPYDSGKRPYVTVMYKDNYRENYPRIVVPTNEAAPGEDAPIFLGKLTDVVPLLTPVIVNKTLKAAYKDIDNAWGTHGEVFGISLFRGKVLSSAIGVSVENTNDVIAIALRLNKQHSYVGVFSFRFVKQTRATLGFTRFPHTCIAEFDSFEAKSTWNFYNALWNELDAAGIPYTFHWGKVNNLNAARLRKMYGPKVDDWISARCRLIPRDMLPVFTNAFMVENGLDTILRPA